MITVRRKPDGAFEITGGSMRLKSILMIHGSAEVTDLSTNQIVHVHEVDGAMVALSEDSHANLTDIANAAINRARA